MTVSWAGAQGHIPLLRSEGGPYRQPLMSGMCSLVAVAGARWPRPRSGTVYALWFARRRAASRPLPLSGKGSVMARNVSVVITDDLDGSAGAQTVAFSLDEVSYEIDLAQPNRCTAGGSAGSVHRGGPEGHPWRRPPRVRPGGRAAGGPRRGAGLGTAGRLEVSERRRISAAVLKQDEAAR